MSLCLAKIMNTHRNNYIEKLNMQTICCRFNLFQVKQTKKERSNIKNNRTEEFIIKELFIYRQDHYLYEF